MISTLQSRGLTVGGLIALVDTRTPEELAAWRNRSDPTDLLDSSNQVVLVHAPVMKRQRGKARWRIDPETPEPQEVTAEQEWTGTLSGAGAVALPGRVVARWLVDFAALRHKHYTHGGHHSEFVCDLKRLFHRPEVRTAVAGRLNLYVRQNSIDLIVYANHSNAYLLVDMIREACGSERAMPAVHVALCRHARGERTYVIPRSTQVGNPKRILLLDDGIVTGATMRSIIAGVLSTYPHAKEIHAIVFSNEMASAQTKYWTAVGASSHLALRGFAGRRSAFLSPKFHFSSFLSLPHPAYLEQDCPLCRRQREFERYANDADRTTWEQEFYRAWAADLVPRDIDHDTDEVAGAEAVAYTGITRSHVEKSRAALVIAQFDILLQKDLPLSDLIAAASRRHDIPTHVTIHCLRSLLHLGPAVLGTNEHRAVWEQLLAVIREPSTDRRHRLLALKAFIWEQFDPPSVSDFMDLLRTCATHLGDSPLLGGLMAFGRLSFAPAHRMPPSQREDVSRAIDQARSALATADADAQIGLSVVNDWLVRAGSAALGPSVVRLKTALLPRRGHSNVRNDLETLSQYLSELPRQRGQDNLLARRIRFVTTCLVQHFIDLDKAGRVVAPHDPSQSTESWDRSLDEAYERLGDLRCLMGSDVTADPMPSRDLAYRAGAALAQLKSVWFSSQQGYARRLLRPFFQPLLPAIEDAINRGREEYARQFPTHNVFHDTSALGTPEGASIEVLIQPTLLADTLHNIVSNVWKDVVPWCISQKREPRVKWTYRTAHGVLTLVVTDNGPGLPTDFDILRGPGGHARLRPQVMEYDGMYLVRQAPSGGTEVQLALYSRRSER
jgi:orotate phosphoribosyltransferase